ncbi:UNVERIFIED_ORG: hypothetical protein ABIB19_003372 [Arthrobacter sp. UYEF10]
MWLPSPSPSCTKRSNLDKRGLDHLDVFGFDLTADELSVIDGLERDGRTGPHPAEFNG